MAVEVQVRTMGSATVVKVVGVGCGELLGVVAEGLQDVAADCRLLVVDLDDTTLSDVRNLEAFVQPLTEVDAEVRIVCRRLSARRLLRAWAPMAGLPVVPTMAEALSDQEPVASADRHLGAPA